MKILLINPRGFCAGVDRAIHIVERALEKYGAPVYVRHEIVHNKSVVNSLKERGTIFVKEVNEVPNGSVIIFSAHGVGTAVYEAAQKKNLTILDASCPLVKKVHISAQQHDKNGTTVILIGHKGHPEVEGHLGQLPEKMYLVRDLEDVEALPFSSDTKLAYITQTTLSIDEAQSVIDALKMRYPKIIGPQKGNLCYATSNRQAAVRAIAGEIDLLLVVGSANSSNSNRLRELGEDMGIRSYLLDGPEDICTEWFDGVESLGISSGASAPENLVKAVIAHITKTISVSDVIDQMTTEQNIQFPLPEELQK